MAMRNLDGDLGVRPGLHDCANTVEQHLGAGHILPTSEDHMPSPNWTLHDEGIGPIRSSLLRTV